MGLNVGVSVRQQDEGYMCEGCNPKGTLDEITARAEAFVRERVPTGFSFHPVVLRDGWYEFDMRPFHYGSELPKNGIQDLHKAIVEWVLDNFGSSSLEMRVYFEP